MKSQKLVKVVAMMLALILCVGIFAACKKDTENPNGTKAPVSTQSGASDVPLVVAYSQFSEKFSPFFASTSYDRDVADMTQVGLMTTDRTGAIVYNAIEGETIAYNGTDYDYTGLSDLKVEEKDGKTVYTIKMREDVVFSDGVAATINDVIFYYYVILDPAYTGASTLSSCNIVGYENYRYNNSNAENIDAEALIADIENQEKIQEYAIENIIKPILTEELDWVKGLYQDEKYTSNPDWAKRFEDYPEAKDVMYLFFYGLDAENYDPTSATEEEVLNKLFEEYGYDFYTLGEAYAGDKNYFNDQTLIDAVYEIALEEAGDSEEVPNVSGIKKIDEYTVEVTTKGYAANAVYQIGAAQVVPMHYYGDASLYDYDNNKFGFNNRTDDSMKLIETHTTEPMGAGAYKFVKFEDKVVYFESNELYWRGAPKTKFIQFKETASDDMVVAVATGAADVASDITGSVQKFAEISGYNTDTNKPTGNTITSSMVWQLGYGYIGINSGTVNVANEPGSEASKNLRKGFATVLAVYRETNINSYYDTVAAIVEYPISTTSWAAPQTSDEGYQIAFSNDVDGNPIYTADMTAEQKYDAALEAAIGYFKAAGYTFDEASGKFTEAPEGAKLSYEIIIPGDGSGDHPNYGVAYSALEALKTIGITLTINDPTDADVLWNKLDQGTQELWTAAWSSTIDPDMYQVYHSNNRKAQFGGASNTTGSNHYQIADPDLDEKIMDARVSSDQSYRKAIYRECLDIVMDWAVEIPVYQRKNVVIFSTPRVNLDTLTPDITTYWPWTAELETLEMVG